MATNHYDTGSSSDAAGLRNDMQAVATAWNRLVLRRNIMIAQKVIGASGDAEFADIATIYGFDDAASAAAAFAELDSSWTATDAKIQQMVSRFL